MKNKKVLPEDLLMNTSLDTIAEIIENFPGMCVSTSINLENSIVKVNNSFFTNFYNTVAYGFNYALEVMAPLSKNICEYFAGTSQNIENNLHVPNVGDAPELWDSFTSYYI